MSSPGRPGLGQSPVFRRTIDINLASRNKNTSFKWSFVNGILCTVFAYDLSCKCPNYTTYFHVIEYVIAAVLALNCLYHLVHYVYLVLNLSPVPVTPAQKKLLGFTDLDTSYKLQSPTPSAPSPIADQSEPFNVSNRSWRTGSSPDTSRQSVASASWPPRQGSPSSPPRAAPAADYSTAEDFIADRHSLQEYLRHFEQKEAMSSFNGSADELDASALWSAAPEFAGRLRPQYQLAPLNSVRSAAEEAAGGAGGDSQHVWWRLHLDPQHLTQWNLNLRLWISATILERLVKEIASIDEALYKHGLSDVKVGMVGLERLRKTASASASRAPTLPALVPFLELDNNQEYLVQRIRELASGGCMSAYKWNGGGTFKDKSWDETLPTDSELVMHLLATYLDTQLLPVTQHPDGAPFTSQHYSRAPAKPPRSPNTLAIHQATLRPPHFVLLRGEEAIEVAKGRNNLIHTFLLFLHTVVTEHHGMLGRVNLGRSGVNVLWVIDR